MFTEDMLDDFVETTFIFQFVSNVTVENMQFISELADWLISEACVVYVQNRCTENSTVQENSEQRFREAAKNLEAVAFYYFGTLQLFLLKCKQTPKWKKQISEICFASRRGTRKFFASSAILRAR